MKKLFVMLVVVVFAFSCELEEDGFPDISISTDITSDYLLNGELDVYLNSQQVFRHKGKPGIQTIPIGGSQLEDFQDCFILYVSSGSESIGTVSSAVMTLDGIEVLNTSDFSNVSQVFTFEVCNLNENSELEIEIRGEPGSYLDIWMEGKIKFNLIEGLVAYWKFDEIGGTFSKDSYSNNDGSASNSRVFESSIPGISGTCADFTQGHDYIKSTSEPFSFGYGPFTFSAWINVESIDFLSYRWGTIIEKRNFGVGNTSPFLLIRPNRALAFGAAGWYTNPKEHVLGTTELELDTWYHIVGVRSTNSQILYINGELEASANMTNLNSGNPYELYIGRRQTWINNEDCAFTGFIDDMAIWNRALSEDEVAHLFNNTDWFGN